MKLFRRLATASAALAVGLAILGSWVRINNAGMTCPDWPLCNGALIPSLHGGVMLEWSHRLVAFVESFVIIGAIVSGWRIRKEIAGITPTLSALGVIFLIQVILGGATVHLSNSPLSVMLHWGMAMALLADLVTLAVLAWLAPQPLLLVSPAPQTILLGLAAASAFGTMCIGSYVSSSYAGLACPTFPLCDGSLLGQGELQLVQMLHRFAAAIFSLLAIVASGFTWSSPARGARLFARLGLGLTLVQIVLGALNVAWALPTPLREAHAANAVAAFLCYVLAAVLAALEPGLNASSAELQRERRARSQRIAANS